MTQPAVEVHNLTKMFRLYHERNQSIKAAIMRGGRATYEDFLALDDVSFEVPEGKTFGLIGHNGSGKSTLLKCLAQILTPDKGSVSVNGRMSALLELGAGFHPELSGRDNVYLNGTILGMSRKDLAKRFDDIVEFAGLERFIDTPVKNYSSGMYIRLGFSIAVSVEPEILLVDEVLAVGDAKFQQKCAEKISELREDGRTIVVVTHDLGSVRNLCEEVAWLDGGKLRGVGPAGDLSDEYLAEAHTDRRLVSSEGARWGSAEAQINKIELIGPDGEATQQVHTGDEVTIRFHYDAKEAIPKAVFGLAIHSLDGVHVTGPNTREAEMMPKEIRGAGIVEMRIPRLLLTPGTYDISSAIADESALHTFDYWHRPFRFDVEIGTPRETYGGFTSLGGTWWVDALEEGRG